MNADLARAFGLYTTVNYSTENRGTLLTLLGDVAHLIVT